MLRTTREIALKNELCNWLKDKGISFSSKTLRAELWTLAKQHRDIHARKIIDEIAKKSGHEVLRLPPYHCELDAIEFVWADLKNFVAKENTTCNLETVEKLFRERTSVLTSEFYGRCVEHVKRVEEKHSETNRIVDLKIDQLLITIGRESSSDSECNCYGSSEDESN